MKQWKIRKGADRRIRSKHPWVFSNELEQSPKGLPPGSPVVLMDHEDRFLAAGYGNPNSLISFRALTFNRAEKNFYSADFVVQKILKGWKQRQDLGFRKSFRLCYGEGDFLPGIVVDRYVLADSDKLGKKQIFVTQILTYGMSQILSDVNLFFEKLAAESHQAGLSEFSWTETSVVVRNDVSIRKLEGLTLEETRVLNLPAEKISSLHKALIAIDDEFSMECDLIDGQKTGFFLDQVFNIFLMCNLLKRMNLQGRTLKVLDLCCYVGHWSSRIAHEVSRRGGRVEATCVDVSETALSFAKRNVERAGGQVTILKQDVLESLSMIPEGQFDIVIADPPAFIKSKKDIPTGTHAYLKLNTSAFKFAKPGGLVASCSCSGLFEESMLQSVVEKAIRRNEKQARCISHGGHSADHPVLLGFTEGFYLKMFIHQMNQE